MRGDDQEQLGGLNASTVVSYVLMAGGGAVLGFLFSLCAIGNQARFFRLGDEASHALIIVVCTVGGAVSGALGAYRTLGAKRRRDRRR